MDQISDRGSIPLASTITNTSELTKGFGCCALCSTTKSTAVDTKEVTSNEVTSFSLKADYFGKCNVCLTLSSLVLCVHFPCCNGLYYKTELIYALKT